MLAGHRMGFEEMVRSRFERGTREGDIDSGVDIVA